jgi:hypothetical protein
MNIYNIIFAKLAVMLPPTMLRKQVLSAVVKAIVSQLDYIGFAAFRQRVNYRLQHTGQVCYLRAVLNDTYDTDQRRITIGDGILPTITLVYWREAERLVGVPTRESGSALVVGIRGTAVGGGYDFTVNVPAEIYADNTMVTQITATINEYKLVSKQFQILSL